MNKLSFLLLASLLGCSQRAEFSMPATPTAETQPPALATAPAPAATTAATQTQVTYTPYVTVKNLPAPPAPSSVIVVQSCRVDPGDERLLVAPTDGMITELFVHEGDIIKATDKVAQLDERLVAAKKTEIQAEYSAAKTKSESDAAIKAAQAQYDRTQKQLARLDKLMRESPGAATMTEYDDALAEFKVAKAALEKAGADRMVDAQVVQVAIAKYRSIEVELALRTIKSPIAGVVDTIHRRVGEYAAQDRPIVTIRSLSEVLVEGYITDSEYQKLTATRSFTARVFVLSQEMTHAEPKMDTSVAPFVATVEHLPSELFQSGTRQIRFRVTNRVRETHPELGYYELVPGMNVRVEISSEAFPMNTTVGNRPSAPLDVTRTGLTIQKN